MITVQRLFAIKQQIEKQLTDYPSCEVVLKYSVLSDETYPVIWSIDPVYEKRQNLLFGTMDSFDFNNLCEEDLELKIQGKINHFVEVAKEQLDSFLAIRQYVDMISGCFPSLKWEATKIECETCILDAYTARVIGTDTLSIYLIIMITEINSLNISVAIKKNPKETRKHYSYGSYGEIIFDYYMPVAEISKSSIEAKLNDALSSIDNFVSALYVDLLNMRLTVHRDRNDNISEG
jgi:hypothetical protein